MPLRLVTFGLAVLVFIADRLTKLYIQTHVSAFDTYPVIPGFFNIVHTQNPGAAFGLLADSSSPLRTVLLVGVSLSVLAFIGVSLWSPEKAGFSRSKLLLSGLSLVLGGAIGNVYDRLAVGSVTDFLQFFFGSYEFPSFNVADSAITVGAALLILDLWRGSRRARIA